jgi:hypothetical protein
MKSATKLGFALTLAMALSAPMSVSANDGNGNDPFWKSSGCSTKFTCMLKEMFGQKDTARDSRPNPNHRRGPTPRR